MPRKPKTPAGRPAQGVEAIAGQTYGRGVEQEDLQRVMPSPDRQTETRQAVVAAAPQAVAPRPQMSFGQLLNVAQGAGRGAGLLTSPTGRLDEPLTAGLPVGRGPGPEVLNMRPAEPPGVQFLDRLSQITGDPYFAELARRGRR